MAATNERPGDGQDRWPASAVVVGGSSQIAEAILARLARRGLGRAVLCGRDSDRLGASARRLESEGLEVAGQLACDVRDTAALAALAADAARLLGRIDLLLVAAGALGPEHLQDLGPDAVAGLVADNFAGPAAAVAAFVPLLAAQRSGRIVVLSSVAGVRVRRANFAYGSAKAGLDAFALGLGDALSGTGVEVVVVRPGFVHTKMTSGRRPQPLAIEAEDVATSVVAGLERGRRVIWAPPILRLVFFAAGLVPGRLWARLRR